MATQSTYFINGIKDSKYILQIIHNMHTYI